MHMPVRGLMANDRPQDLTVTFANFTVVSES